MTDTGDSERGKPYNGPRGPGFRSTRGEEAPPHHTPLGNTVHEVEQQEGRVVGSGRGLIVAARSSAHVRLPATGAGPGGAGWLEKHWISL